jgi:hypothetical protein
VTYWKKRVDQHHKTLMTIHDYLGKKLDTLLSVN